MNDLGKGPTLEQACSALRDEVGGVLEQPRPPHQLRDLGLVEERVQEVVRRLAALAQAAEVEHQPDRDRVVVGVHEAAAVDRPGAPQELARGALIPDQAEAVVDDLLGHVEESLHASVNRPRAESKRNDEYPLGAHHNPNFSAIRKHRIEVEAAREAVRNWQNQFDTIILNVGKDTGVPAHLLKNIFAKESLMKIGLNTDSLGHLSFDEMLDTAAEAGVQMLEFCCGGWSSAPHVGLNLLLENEKERNNFAAKIRDRGLEIDALNCSGNQLAPGERGKSNDQVVRKTFELARCLDIRRIVMMSGLPGGPGDQNANWITIAWPPEVHEILRYQWEDVAIPYWRDLAKYARENGIEKICVEQHGHQLVYNTETLLKLRVAVGAAGDSASPEFRSPLQAILRQLAAGNRNRLRQIPRLPIRPKTAELKLWFI